MKIYNLILLYLTIIISSAYSSMCKIDDTILLPSKDILRQRFDMDMQLSQFNRNKGLDMLGGHVYSPLSVLDIVEGAVHDYCMAYRKTNLEHVLIIASRKTDIMRIIFEERPDVITCLFDARKLEK